MARQARQQALRLAAVPRSEGDAGRGLTLTAEIPVAEDWLAFRWVPLTQLGEAQLQPACLVEMIQARPPDDSGLLGWGSNYGN